MTGESRQSRHKKRKKVSEKFTQLNLDQGFEIEDSEDENHAEKQIDQKLAANKKTTYTPLNIKASTQTNQNLLQNDSKKIIQKRKSYLQPERNILRTSSVPNLNRSVRSTQIGFDRTQTFAAKHIENEKNHLENSISGSDDEENLPLASQADIVKGHEEIHVDYSESSIEKCSQLSIRTSNTEPIPLPSQSAMAKYQPEEFFNKSLKQIPTQRWIYKGMQK